MVKEISVTPNECVYMCRYHVTINIIMCVCMYACLALPVALSYLSPYPSVLLLIYLVQLSPSSAVHR